MVTCQDNGKPPEPPYEGPPLRLDDSSLDWAFATGFPYLGGRVPPERARTPYPLLLEVASSLQEFVKIAGEFKDVIEVPDLFRSPNTSLVGATFCTVAVSEAFFERSQRLAKLHEAIRRFDFGLPGLALPTLPKASTSNRKLPAKGVVTAVMDDGLAFAHQRFRRANGTTRMEYVWKQPGPPSTQSPGLFLTAAQIDIALAKSIHCGIVDEDEVYRRLKFEVNAASGHKPLGRRRAHGTHVMDLACGCDPVAGELYWPIIGVQFPNSAIRDTSGAWLAPHVYAGLLVILYCADLIASTPGSGPLPVVVNVSYGNFAGPHDGKSLLERAIDELIALRQPIAPLAVVLPSGNSFLARCHARFELAPMEERTLDWRVQPDDRTPSFLEIWPGPVNAAGIAPDLEVRIAPPGSPATLLVSRGAPDAPWPTAALPLAKAQYRTAGAPPLPHRDKIDVQLAPTATLNASDRIAPAGTWRVSVKNVGTSSAHVNAWIQRDDTPYGWPITGRQSRFDDAAYVRFGPSGRYLRNQAAGNESSVDNTASCTERAGSINAIATGAETVVIGAYRKSDNTASGYSSGGPLVAPGNRVGFAPDAMAVGDDSIACAGVLAAGTRSGSVVAMRGTSVAAPQIARWLADQMAVGALANRASVQGLASTGVPAPPVPTDRQGNGRIDVRPQPRVPRR